MKRLLLPLLAAIALPAAVNATDYVECEAIANATNRFIKKAGSRIDSDENRKTLKRLYQDAQKCFYLK